MTSPPTTSESENPSSPTAVFFILGDYLNAMSLDEAIREVYPGAPVVFISIDGRNLVGRLRPRQVEKLSGTDDQWAFLQALVGRYPLQTIKYLLLTNEQWHPLLWQHRQWLSDHRVVCHIGRSDPAQLLSKTRFAELAGQQLGLPVPGEYCLDRPEEIQFPLLVKFRSSFIDGQKFGRKFIFQDRAQLDRFLQRLSQPQRQNLVLQELLSTRPQDNISIAGWYSTDRPLLFQTQKLVQHPPQAGNGGIVRLMELEQPLVEMTHRICQAVNYEGPFELEFIRDKGVYKVLEFNPRFWMQHGLIQRNTRAALIRLYCGQSVTDVADKAAVQLWINPLVCLYRLLRLDMRPIRLLWGRRFYSPLTLRETLRWIAMHYLSLPV